MRHDFIDRYSRLDSSIHRIPAPIKIISAIVLILFTVLLPQEFIVYYVILIFVLIVIAIASKIPFSFLLRRLILLEPLVLGVAVLALFQPHGVSIFLRILLKSSICLFIVILISNTMPFARLLELFRRIHVPSILITILALMYRYLFVLIDETERMERARMSRMFSKNKKKIWQTRAVLVGQLFIRSSERAERIYSAMRARGWK